jgi:hypothetical protein
MSSPRTQISRFVFCPYWTPYSSLNFLRGTGGQANCVALFAKHISVSSEKNWDKVPFPLSLVNKNLQFPKYRDKTSKLFHIFRRVIVENTVRDNVLVYIMFNSIIEGEIL